MALAKLWTALFGKREEAKQLAAPKSASETTIVSSNCSATATSTPAAKSTQTAAPAAKATVSPSATAAPLAEPTDKRTRVRDDNPRVPKSPKTAAAHRKTGKKADVVAPLPAIAPVPATPEKQFQRRQTAWTKRIGNCKVSSILDLSISDGTHVAELLETVVDSSLPVTKYVVISQFEMSGQSLSLQQFHKKVRLCGGLPVAIPMERAEGLRQLARTIGTVDLILLDQASSLADAAVSKLFKRIMHSRTLVYSKDSKGTWQPIAAETTQPAMATSTVKLQAAKEPSVLSAQPRKAA